MSVRPLYVELSAGGETVRLSTGAFSDDGLLLGSDGIEGWYATPDSKVSMTEMETGDGAHAVAEQDILYSARTVTLNWTAGGGSRQAALAGIHALLKLAHRLVDVRVVDADSDTYATGYIEVGTDAGIASGVATGTVTVTCPDPRRYSTTGHSLQMFPTGTASGGLYYGEEGDGLYYPLSYGHSAETLQNVATLTNDGTSPAYPVVTVTGPIDAGLRIDCGGGLSVSYSQPVRGVPLVLDFLARTASVGGLDTSRHLESRGFAPVPAGGSLSLGLQATGTGWATVEWHDTYI